MFLTVMMSRSMLMLMLVLMLVLMFMLMLVFMFMSVNGANTCRVLARQSTSAISTHYSISIEATSNSRPARNSPLSWWQEGHSASMSSA